MAQDTNATQTGELQEAQDTQVDSVITESPTQETTSETTEVTEATTEVDSSVESSVESSTQDSTNEPASESTSETTEVTEATTEVDSSVESSVESSTQDSTNEPASESTSETLITKEEVEKADTPTTQDPPLSDEERLALEIDKALQSNEWSAQVKLSLIAVKECYVNLQAVHNFYATSIQTLKDTQQAHDNALNEAHTLNDNITQHCAQTIAQIETLLTQTQESTSEAQRAEDSAIERADDITNKANTIIAQGEDLIKRSAVVEKALKEFKKLESLIIKSQELKFDLASALENHKRELENKKEDTESEIIAKFNEVSTELEREFQTHSQALQTQFNNAKAALDSAQAKTLDLQTLLQEYINASKAEFEAHRQSLSEQKDLADRALNALKVRTLQDKEAHDKAHSDAIEHIKRTADLNTAKLNGVNNLICLKDESGEQKIDFSYMKYTFGASNEEILKKEAEILEESNKLIPLKEALNKAYQTPPTYYKKRNIWGQRYGNFEDWSNYNSAVGIAKPPYDKQVAVITKLKKKLNEMHHKNTLSSSTQTLHRGDYEIILGSNFLIKSLKTHETFTYNFILLELKNTTYNRLTLKIDMLLGGAFYTSLHQDKMVTTQKIELLDAIDGARWKEKLKQWLAKAPTLAELPQELHFITGKSIDSINNNGSVSTPPSNPEPFLYDKNILLCDYKKHLETNENQKDFIFSIKPKDSMFLLISTTAFGVASMQLWGNLFARFSLQILGEEIGESPEKIEIELDNAEFETKKAEVEAANEQAKNQSTESSTQASDQTQQD